MDLVFLVSKPISLCTFHSIDTFIPVSHPGFRVCKWHTFYFSNVYSDFSPLWANKYSFVEKKCNLYYSLGVFRSWVFTVNIPSNETHNVIFIFFFSFTDMLKLCLQINSNLDSINELFNSQNQIKFRSRFPFVVSIVFIINHWRARVFVFLWICNVRNIFFLRLNKKMSEWKL